MPKFRPARLAAAPFALALAAVLGGCSMWGFGDAKPEAKATSGPPPAAVATAEASTVKVSATTATPAPGQIDIRQYLGPDYCPELRILSGAELMRQYEKGHDDDAKYVIWQASVGKTARECLYDQQGGLTLKVGISGRVVAGPKGGATTVTVPLKIAIVKYQEKVLAEETYPLDVAIPADGAVAFTEVKEIAVPSPGKERDYIIYVGFEVGKWDALHGRLEPVVVAAARRPPPIEQPEMPPLPSKPTTPKELPVPDGGFVLPP
jgi:hypothetical protein